MNPNQTPQGKAAKSAKKAEAQAANRDPITKAPGSHPVGTGIGAAAGGAAGIAGTVAGAVAAGATTGLAGGPVGAVAGAAVGAAIGAAAGHKIAEKIDPTVEDSYWRQAYADEPYYIAGYDYAEYEPAYRLGYETYGAYRGKSFEQSERDLQAAYEQRRGNSRLDWPKAKGAVRSAWDRLTGRDKDDELH